MNKVYFSNETITTMDKWGGIQRKKKQIFYNTGNVLKVFIYPKNIFSINGWKMAFMFMKDFSCSFLKEENSNE